MTSSRRAGSPGIVSTGPSATFAPPRRITAREHNISTSDTTWDDTSDRPAAAARVGEGLQERHHAEGVEPARRLVQKQHIGIVEEGLRDREAPQLSAREPPRRGPRFLGEAEALEHRVGARAERLAAQPAQRAEVEEAAPRR